MTQIQGFAIGTIEKNAERKLGEKSGKAYLSFNLRLDERTFKDKTYKGKRVGVSVFYNVDEMIGELTAGRKVTVCGEIGARGYEYEGKVLGEVTMSARVIEFESPKAVTSAQPDTGDVRY